MKNRNLLLVTIIFSFTLFFTSCDEDFLVKSDPGAGTVDGFFKTVLAIATLCFSPPDNLRPLSPTIVLYLFGILSIKS